MNYVARTQIPQEKFVLVSLKYVYGIGHSRSSFLCKKLGFLSNLKVQDMNTRQWNNLITLVEKLRSPNNLSSNFDLDSDLKDLIKQNEKTLITLNTYRGFRKKKGLPSRGQRTHSNAQTARRFTEKKVLFGKQKKKLPIKKNNKKILNKKNKLKKK